MWCSEEDVLRDLASLNDFGAPGDSEAYRVICSKGRGSKIQKPIPSSKFLDPRSGEFIDFDDTLATVEPTIRSKGRGIGLSRHLKSTHELQKQLRLVRPLGSRDEAIELYFNKNKPKPKSINDTVSSDSKPSLPIPEVPTETKFFHVKTANRVKGSRNSKTQNNVLMSTLISKENTSSSIKSCMENLAATSELLHNSKPTNHMDEENSNSRGIKDPQCSHTHNIKDREVSHINNNHEKSFDNEEMLNSIYVNFGEMNLNKTEGSEAHSPLKEIHDQKEVYRRLGERLNKSNSIQENSIKEGIYDFTPYLKHISPANEHLKMTMISFYDSVEADFKLNEKEFPPLRNFL